MYALVDCNNFYCSCERLSKPFLEGKPVVVLSNNDGCVIARSDEAKALGIEMGTPEFMVRENLTAHQVAIYSSNYTLYGDISSRVMKTLESFVPRIEIYSIDEAFLDLHHLPYHHLLQLGVQIRHTVKQHIGMPVSIGIAATKTLAKMANRYAKKHCRHTGVHYAASKGEVENLLAATATGDIWGIGKQYAALLLQHGFRTAFDVSNAPEQWMKQNMTVVGQRLWNELNGIPAIAWEVEPPKKKNICTSRSFGKLLTDEKIIKEALCDYTANVAKKLRQQNSCAKELYVFVQTNVHRTQDKQYYRAIKVRLEVASNNSCELIKYALQGFKIIYRAGYNYMKCGVIANDLVPENEVQKSLFQHNDTTKSKQLMAVLDSVNRGAGKEILKTAVQGTKKEYSFKAEYLSAKFTTNINEVIKVK